MKVDFDIFCKEGLHMRIAVIDGQGGGIGRALCQELSQKLTPPHELIALGTNALATASMLRAGAHRGATGENAVVRGARSADVIVGPIAIALSCSMLGELTEKMAAAVGESDAYRVLIPTERCNTHVVGAGDRPLTALLQEAVSAVLAYVENAGEI